MLQFGKILQYEYVQRRLPETKKESCLGIQNKYHVQIIALGRRNSFIVWFPNAASCLESDDVVYYLPDGDVRGDGFKKFQDEVVRKDTHTDVKMNAVEFTPKLDRCPIEARSLYQFVIGAKEHQGKRSRGMEPSEHLCRPRATRLIRHVTGTVVWPEEIPVKVPDAA